MNEAVVDRVTHALLYEGYILYPYRPSIKNQQRWTFGGLYPRAYAETQTGNDAAHLQAECLMEAGPQTALDVTVRFLHLQSRRVAVLEEPATEPPVIGDPAWRWVPSIRVGDRQLHTWEEAVEREIHIPRQAMEALVEHAYRHAFEFPAQRTQEAVRDDAGMVAAMLLREQEPLQGSIEISAVRLTADLVKLTVRVCNDVDWRGRSPASRAGVLPQTLASTHVILHAVQGEFVSLIDPPEHCRELVQGCRNQGVWPVLVGDEGERDTLLASPIILYDYPQVAPESPGDLFDASEIDEILTLRILTLTEEEKQALVGIDERARAMLERTEALTAKELGNLHGTIRHRQVIEGGAPS